MKLFNLLLILPMFLSSSLISNKKMKNDVSEYHKVDEYLESVYKDTHLPGFSLSITNKDETVAQMKYGNFDSYDDIYFIGSESKSFTALATMKLVKENKIDLDKDIKEYIDINLSKTVTTRMLLNQTSGFDEYQMLNKAKVVSSKYGNFQYANENFDTLGRIIESVSKTTYAEYVKQNILDPLGMNDTYANTNEIPKQRMGDTYRNYFGFYIKSKPIFPTNKGWFNVPAGYIASTSNDMCKYLRMYLNNGGGIFDSSIINEMVSSRVVSNADGKTYYGYGLFIVDYYGTDIYFHQGLTEGCQTYMFIIPSLGIAGEYIFPSYDQFVNTSYLEDMVFNTFNILLNRSIRNISSNYVSSHMLYDAIYLLVIVLAITCLVFGIMSIKKEKKLLGNIIKVVCGCIYIVLLLLVPSMFGASYFAVSHYVPDLFLIVILSVIITLGGTICNVVSLIRNILKKKSLAK